MSWPLVAAKIHSKIYAERVDEIRTTSMRASTVSTRTLARQGEWTPSAPWVDEKMNDGERAAEERVEDEARGPRRVVV
eukprot:927342-Heterocapsa_arctica.AAC.1